MIVRDLVYGLAALTAIVIGFLLLFGVVTLDIKYVGAGALFALSGTWVNEMDIAKLKERGGDE